MTDVLKTTIELIISDEILSQSAKNAVSESYNIVSCTEIDDYISSHTVDNISLIVCQMSVLGDDSAKTIATIKSVNPNARIIIIGFSCASDEQIALLKHGARGYFDASSSLGRLNEAIECVLHGEVWIERHVISGLIDELTHTPEISNEQRQAVLTLSPKELEVAQLVSHGATNKMIAKNMAITERTVKAHLTTIFQKMNLTDRLSLAIFFRDLRA